MDSVLKERSQLKSTLVDETLEQINFDRKGGEIDLTKIGSVVELFCDLDLYQIDFHDSLIANTKEFYQKEISSMPISDSDQLRVYLGDVKNKINEEKKRVHEY